MLCEVLPKFPKEKDNYSEEGTNAVMLSRVLLCLCSLSILWYFVAASSYFCCVTFVIYLLHCYVIIAMLSVLVM